MKRLIGMALGGTLFLGGCEGSPLQALIQETFGQGQQLQTNAYVTEIAPGLPFPSPQLVFTPDGSRYAFINHREDGRLYVGNSGQAPRGLGSHAQREPWFSPDGKRLAFAEIIPGGSQSSRWKIKSLEVDSKAVTQVAEAALGHTPWLSWSPDGSTIIYASDEDGDHQAESLNLVTLADPTPRRLGEIAPYPWDKARALWSPDGKEIAYLTKIPNFMNAYNLTIQTLADGKTRVLRRVPGQNEFVWSSDGTAIAYLASESKSGDFTFHRILVADGSEEVTPFSLGEPTEIRHGSELRGWAGFYASDLSPDLRYCLVRRGEEPIYARELATGRHIQLTDTLAWVRRWTADSKAIIASSTKLSLERYYRIQVER